MSENFPEKAERTSSPHPRSDRRRRGGAWWILVFLALGGLGPSAAWAGFAAGDFDRDHDVDLTDYAHFHCCLNGPGATPPLVCGGCADADWDYDGDVDLADFRPVQACFSGAGEVPQCPFAPPFVEVPDPLSGDNPRYPLTPQGVPAPGQSVEHAAFGTTQTRVVQTQGLRHEYSRFDPFNRDRSMILLQYVPSGEWRVYRTQSIPYDQPANLVRTLAVEEPRWDPDTTEVIWGVTEFRLVTVNVQAGTTTTVKDFSLDATIGPIITAHPDLWRITNKDEGESSTDKRGWAFLLQGSQDDYRVRYLFTWDRVQNQVLGVYTLSPAQSIIDWAGMSAQGNWVLIGGGWDNASPLTGLTMANRELTQFHRLDYATAHADVGLDSDGNEVVVMQNIQTDYIDWVPIAWNTLPILEPGGSYAGTNRTPLVRLYYDSGSPIGFNSGVHISCNVPGYCVVSTSTEPGFPEQNWLDRTITLVQLERTHPRVFYLAKVYGTAGAYWEETHATITNDGAAVIWATNWNTQVGQERVWDMQLNMPAEWRDALDHRP